MEHISIPALFGFLIILIIFSGFFSGSETGMMSINRYRLRHLARKKHRKAMRVNRLLERPDRLLGVILIGNTFANILASMMATLIAARLLGDIGLLIAPILLTLIVLIFAEIAPKTVAALYPQKVAFAASLPLAALLKVLYPLVWLANSTANSLLSLLRIQVGRHAPEHLSGEELRTVVTEAGGLIPTEHKEMLLRILDLEKVTVDDIMIPRTEIVGIDLNDPWDEVIEHLENSQHTRLPIYKDSIDNVLGIVHLRSVLNLLAEGKLNKRALTNIAEESYFVPEATPLNVQLLNFQAAKCRSGLVVDEYGDIQGLVTLEDILEEIVGEFTTDIAAIHKSVRPQKDGSVIVDGGIAIRELNRLMKWKLPEEGPKTFSGLIIEHLEAIPVSGTGMRIAGYPIEVLKVKGNMVKKARVYSNVLSSQS